MNVIGTVLMIIGSLFFALGGFGILRMPDIYNRSQAGTKATTLGAFSLLLGVGFMNPEWLPKILLLIVFIGITNPVGSSVLTRAAYLSKIPAYKTKVDELREVYDKRSDLNEL